MNANQNVMGSSTNCKAQTGQTSESISANMVKCELAETVKLGLSLADQCKCMYSEKNPCLKAYKEGFKLVKKQEL